MEPAERGVDGEGAESPEWAGLRPLELGEFDGVLPLDLSRLRMLSIEKEFWLDFEAGCSLGLLSATVGLLSAAARDGEGVGICACRANAALGEPKGKCRGPRVGGGGKPASGGRAPTAAANGERCMNAGW